MRGTYVYTYVQCTCTRTFTQTQTHTQKALTPTKLCYRNVTHYERPLEMEESLTHSVTCILFSFSANSFSRYNNCSLGTISTKLSSNDLLSVGLLFVIWLLEKAIRLIDEYRGLRYHSQSECHRPYVQHPVVGTIICRYTEVRKLQFEQCLYYTNTCWCTSDNNMD